MQYENAVDLEAIEDPMLKAATLAQIHEFGQTPGKIFRRPHPPRFSTPPVVVRRGADGRLHVDGAALAWYEPLSPPSSIIGAPEKHRMRVVEVRDGALVAGGAVGDVACTLRGDRMVAAPVKTKTKRQRS